MSTIKEKLEKVRSKVGNKAITVAIAANALLGIGGGNTAKAGNNNSETNNSKITNLNASAELSANLLEVEAEVFANTLISRNENTLENIDIDNRKFSKEELEMIQPGEQGESVLKNAEEISKKSKPKKGEVTKCLRGVRTILEKSGLELKAGIPAYTAIEGLRKNDAFIEIQCDIKDFPYLPDGAIIVWEKGTTKYGHIGMKKGDQEYCDYRYDLKTSNDRGSSGQKYGQHHVFLLKSSVISNPKLIKSLYKESVQSDSKKGATASFDYKLTQKDKDRT